MLYNIGDNMNNRKEIALKFADAIKSEYIIQIILYGSVARGDDKLESDIDILIITNDYEKIESKVYDETYNIIIEDDEVISPQFISQEHYNEIRNFSYISNVIEDGEIIGWNGLLYAKCFRKSGVIQADYDVTVTFDEKTVKERIDVAADFLNKAKEFLDKYT